MRRRIVLCLALCLLLCGCGDSAGRRKAEFPYLNEFERTAFEEQLLDSIYFSAADGTTNAITMYMRNDTDKDIVDLSIIGENTQRTQIYFDLLPAHTAVAKKIYPSEEEKNTKQPYNLSYTIGEYRYLREGIDFDYTKQGEAGSTEIPDVRVFLQTADGKKRLDLSKPIRFETGTEIEGLQDCRIYSISGTYNSLSSNYISMSLNIEGQKPSNGKSLAVKLVDEDGVIRYTGTVFTYSSPFTASIFTYAEPGDYNLRFEELG